VEAAWAVRTLPKVAAFMPMKPARATGSAPSTNHAPDCHENAHVEQAEHDHRVDREHLVLGHEEGHGADADVPRDALHGLVAFGEALDAHVEESRDDQRSS
jgi:hypothetical protein